MSNVNIVVGCDEHDTGLIKRSVVNVKESLIGGFDLIVEDVDKTLNTIEGKVFTISEIINKRFKDE